MQILTKRVYEAADRKDGCRVLVDRLWPRGVSKQAAAIDYWARAFAPSDTLRKWYNHDPDKWPEFRRRYFAELKANPDGIAELRDHMSGKVVTFVFGSKEERFNNAAALREYLEMDR